MKPKFSLILILAILSASFAWAQTKTSSFYNLPDGAFVQGMSTTGTITGGEIYLPYKVGSHKFSSTTGAGDWWSNGNKQTTGKESYSYSNLSVNSKKTIPQLRQSGKISYQYGATDSTKYNTGLYFYVSDSNMHYMTPAKLRADLVNKKSGEAHALIKYYKATKPDDSEVYDTIGLYFNNTAEMYIDGISIPIKNSSATKLSDMFLNDARVIVTFYKATAVGTKTNNALDRNIVYLTDTLTSDNYNQSSDVNTGALNKTFKTPISIDGSFVIELTGYDNCRFNFYSAQERSGCNYWGYYIDNGNVIYPDKNSPSGNNSAYTLAISVHAMFPVLEKQDTEKALEFASAGGEDAVAIISNFNPKSEGFTIDFGDVDWISEGDITYDGTSGEGTLTFTAEPNTTGKTREATITLKHHLKELTYAVSQEAPTLTPRVGMDNEQEFVMSLQDDTVHINGNKVTKVYLESDVSLKDTINVTSEEGLTKIDTTFGSENDKYYVCLTFTRAKYVQENTDDTITVSFKGNSEKKYEYTINHIGAGELSTKPDYHTFVVGPKGGTALAVDANDKITNVDSVRVSSKVPATNIQAEWYNDTPIGEFISESKEDEQGSYRLIKSIKVSEENTTDADRLDSFRVFLPNCDTVKFYVRQEPTARVWQLYGDKYNKMEVNNKGGKAHFKNSTETVMTLFSNTPVTEGDIDITFTSETDKNWVHPSTKIKQTATRDSILITFEVDPWTGIEPRSTDITVSILDNEFIIPLTQKAFGIKLSHEGNSDTLVVPITGGKAFWKDTNFPELNVDCKETYRDGLLEVIAPNGVTITRNADTLSNGQQHTTFTFMKRDTVTTDWSDSIFISFDSINEADNFEYHFKDTIFITQALMPSAYYEVPAGAFFAGMTDNSGQAAGEFYVPYLHDIPSTVKDTFKSEDAGYWQSTTKTDKTQVTYTYPNKITKYNIPQLQVNGKVNYRYGASRMKYEDEELYFHVGNPDMHYMTPARLWADLVTNPTGYQEGYGTGYKTTNSDTMGIYFNNIETMYIDGISIPIALSSGTTEVDVSKLFTKAGSHVKVTIYPATITTGGLSNVPNRDSVIWTGEFTKAHFKPYADDKHYRGALDTIFKTPISINGAFVIELSEMKTSGCVFYVLSDKSDGKNKWGYYVRSGTTTYPKNYCLAVSVRGMFPVLEKKDTKTALEFDPAGGDGAVAFISNIDPESEDFTVDFGGVNWISIKDTTYSEGTYKLSSTDTITFTFTAEPNKTGEAREATITLKHHGKELKYTVSQASLPSAFYELPTGAFFAGMTENGAAADKTFYLPYNLGQEYRFTSTDAGQWTKEGTTTEKATECSYTSCQMNGSYHTPLLAVDGKVSYQYGASGESYDANLYFHVGDSVMHNMTPARLYGDLGKSALAIVGSYKSEDHDTIGLCFNNTDVMYIDGISIPITSNKPGLTVDNLFPNNNSHVKVTIYHAKITDQGYSFDRTDQNTIWDSTLTKKAFKKYSDKAGYCGALNATFKPIPIEGQFVIELREMKTSGCKFYIYAAQIKGGSNKWGYYADKSTRHISTYTPAISVHAMFPALYPKAYTDTVIYIPAEGVGGSSGNERPQRTVFANYEWTKGENGWKRTESAGVTMNYVSDTKSADSTVWMFTMTENTTTTERKGDVTFTFRGKSLTYHLIQVPAPYTRTVTAGEWGTICLPYAAKSFSCAEMYSIAGKMEGDVGIYLDQVATMEAGKPYIFKATATAEEIKVVYAAGEPQKADTVNGLCGYIGKNDTTVLKDAGNYIVYQDALYEVDSDSVTIASNRAYIKYADVPETPSQAPQVRRVAMPINGAPANMLQVSDTKQPVKILRDGHIVILRANKEYDILGQSK